MGEMEVEADFGSESGLWMFYLSVESMSCDG